MRFESWRSYSFAHAGLYVHICAQVNALDRYRAADKQGYTQNHIKSAIQSVYSLMKSSQIPSSKNKSSLQSYSQVKIQLWFDDTKQTNEQQQNWPQEGLSKTLSLKSEIFFSDGIQKVEATRALGTYWGPISSLSEWLRRNTNGHRIDLSLAEVGLHICGKVSRPSAFMKSFEGLGDSNKYIQCTFILFLGLGGWGVGGMSGCMRVGFQLPLTVSQALWITNICETATNDCYFKGMVMVESEWWV